MGGLVLITFLMLNLTLAFDDHHETCPERNSFKYPIRWKDTDTCTVSEPLCLDSNWNIVKRCCNLGMWEPEPKCEHIQIINNCPENGDFIFDSLTKICYKLSKRERFPPKCPYPDVLPFESYQPVLKNIKEPIWMPITRDLSNGLGYLQWIGPNSNYKDEYKGMYQIEGNIIGNNCLLYYNESYISLASCEKNHSSVCAYSLISVKQNKLCSDDCYSSSYDPKSKCFCTDKDDEVPLGELAEFPHSYQTLLYNALTDDDCQFGLERSNGKFMWLGSKTEINYSLWSSDTDFDAKNNFVLFTKDGWILTDKEVKRKIYQDDVIIEKPSLSLEYANDQDKFVIMVNRPNSLKWVRSSNKDLALSLNCFTDAIGMSLIYKYVVLQPSKPNDLISRQQQISYLFDYFKNGPGNYWCEAFQYPDLSLIKSNTVFFFDGRQFKYEFVAILKTNFIRGSDPIREEFLNNIERLIAVNLGSIDHISKNYQSWSRIFKILNIDEINNKITFNIHFTLKKSSSISNYENEITALKQITKEKLESVQEMNFKVQKVLSTKFCSGEISNKFNVNLNWPSGIIGQWVYPNEYCFTFNGHRLNRKCKGDFINGAEWSKISRFCKIFTASSSTKSLNNITYCNNCTSDEIMEKTTSIIDKNLNEIGPLDVYFIGEILYRIKDDDQINVTLFSQMIASVISIPKNTLKHAQIKLNATDRILDLIDEIATNVQNNSVMAKSNDFMIIVESPNDFTGVGLYQNGNDIEVKILTDYIDDIKNEKGLVSLIMLDPELVKQMIEEQSVTKVVLTGFLNHNLFNLNVSNEDPDYISKIFGLVIPNLSSKFRGPITIYHKVRSKNKKNECAYWKYGNEYCGEWQMDNESRIDDDGFAVCQYWHTTHFALLLMSTDKYAYLEQFLEPITYINCTLSLIGLFGILFTGIIFKKWRINTGNQILLNFSFALTLQIVLFYVSNFIEKDSKIVCISIGLALHYSVLSQFFWMFVIAILQFKRFVEVLGGPPKYVLLKACICGWGIPLIPILCVWLLDPNSYVESRVGLCYPSGLGLYLGVWLPISIIFLINFVIFIFIIFNVSNKKTERFEVGNNNEILFQWRLAFLLFFMLGLTWIFGFLSQINFGIIFAFLFNFTATLQGFVMFLFFIVFNETSRNLYVLLAKRCLRKSF